MRRLALRQLLLVLVLVGFFLGYAYLLTTPQVRLHVVRKPTQTPWPTCGTVPYYRIRCDPLKDPFATTTTWRKLNERSR